MIKIESDKTRKKTKVLFMGNFSDPKYEGLMTIVESLKSNLNVDRIYVNGHPQSEKVDLINIHSSGFYEAVKLRGMKGIKIYSLHANIVPLYLMRLLDYIQWVLFVHAKKGERLPLYYRIVKIGANLISNFTPLFVKRFFLNKMDVVVVPTSWLSNKLKLKNSYLIRHGIDIQKFRNIQRNKGKNKLVISFFGHPDPEKGIFEIIDSFSKLQNPLFEKRMFFTEKNRQIESYINKRDKSIKVFGFVNNIVKEYNDSDIVIIPYRHSLGGIATPLVLLESMACEKAVITTDLPHLREICGDTVVYVEPYSIKGIVNSINYLAKNHELRRKLGEKARKRIIKCYNQEKMFREYEKLYKKLLFSNNNK